MRSNRPDGVAATDFYGLRFALIAAAAIGVATPDPAAAEQLQTPLVTSDTTARRHAAESEFRLLFTPRYLKSLLHTRAHLNQAAGLEVDIPRDAHALRFASQYSISAGLAEQIVAAALDEGIDPELAFRLVRVESVFNPNARGPSGALGLTQLMPSTARAVNRSLRTEAEILEPGANLRTGFRYLRRLLDRYEGDVRLALLAYNRGETNVDRALRAGRDPENGYSRKVLQLFGERYAGKGVAEPRP